MSQSFQENVVYMWRENSFFVPNTGLLKNPTGLFAYLQEKVKRHNTCLSCNKKLYSLEAVRGYGGWHAALHGVSLVILEKFSMCVAKRETFILLRMER